MDRNQFEKVAVDQVTDRGEMTIEQMLARISFLADEMDANDEENRMMQSEINSLYAKIEAAKG